MKAPRVSILMAVYNAAPYLREAVDSVLNQTLQDVELLAVDDASTDESLAILRQYAHDYPEKVKVFGQAYNQGQAVARNVALHHSHGEYICMLDADDWFSPDALQLALESFESPEIGCVVFRLVEEHDGVAIPYPQPLPKSDPITGKEAFCLSLSWTLHGLYMVRRSIHTRFPYDTSCRLYSDDNTTRLHYLHSPLVAFCQGEYHYRKHLASTTTCFSAQRFLHMQANLNMKKTLEREGVDRQILDKYERIRWNIYKGQLRLFHINGKKLGEKERRLVHHQLREIYATFDFRRHIPFNLFELRQWLGYKLKRHSKKATCH